MNIQQILNQLGENPKRGDIRILAKQIKKDHTLALQLWQTGNLHARALSTLIFDKKLLTSDVIDQFVIDLQHHDRADQLLVMDWLFANQLTKTKNLLDLIQTWRDSDFPLQRRTYWYYQGRLRWMGKCDQTNSAQLLTFIEAHILNEDPMVQWAMNFLAGWIGVFEDEFHDRCIQLGQETGLYRGMKVAKNCTPDYLPDFIRIERDKRNENTFPG